MAYPTGFEQLLDAVRSWEAPYFKQRELGEQKAEREGKMALELAKLDLANKVAIVDNAYKRAQIPLFDTQNKQAKIDLEKARKELGDLNRQLQDKHDLTRAQIYHLMKTADAAMKNAIGSGALTAKEKKIANFTSRIMDIGRQAIMKAGEGNWEKFSKWWVDNNLPPEALNELAPYFNSIVNAPYDSPARTQFRNFIMKSLYNPVLTSSGLQDADIPDWTKNQLLQPYSFEGIETGKPVVKTGGGFWDRILGGAKQPATPPAASRPQSPQTVALPGRNVQRAGRGVVVNRNPSSTNVYGSGNMLANKPAPASTGRATGAFELAPTQEADIGISALKPSTKTTGQWEQVFYNGKMYLVNPQTEEVRTMSGTKVLFGKKKIIQHYKEQATRGIK